MVLSHVFSCVSPSQEGEETIILISVWILLLVFKYLLVCFRSLSNLLFDLWFWNLFLSAMEVYFGVTLDLVSWCFEFTSLDAFRNYGWFRVDIDWVGVDLLDLDWEVMHLNVAELGSSWSNVNCCLELWIWFVVFWICMALLVTVCFQFHWVK